MQSLRPSSALQAEKLAKNYQKTQYIKKNIVMTKYSKRHQSQLRQAMRIRQHCFDNLPPVMGPLDRADIPRRHSSEVGAQQQKRHHTVDGSGKKSDPMNKKNLSQTLNATFGNGGGSIMRVEN